jgi:hypothetical protein
VVSPTATPVTTYKGKLEPRKVRSGKQLTPIRMVEAVRELASGWNYDAVSIGYPGMVGEHGPRSEPRNLGPGWVAFNFAAAFGVPVRIIMMQLCKLSVATKVDGCYFWRSARE